MKVLFAVKNDAGLDSELDERFGRAGYFLIYDTEAGKILSIEENKARNEGHGVGLKTSAYVVEKGCAAAVGAQAGPKAADILRQAGVKMIVENKGTVKEMLEKHRSGLAA
ncbi:MAG: NifB/NifX family molybdenum-iron cluster-binding protein [Candidatus Aminicenantes bacterium]|nr:NifB/NifX family molybdenum-iron cluster-binding protein [Candidatus Aminicenantes bacterium]